MEFWAGRFKEGALERGLPGREGWAGPRRARWRRRQRSLGLKLERLESRMVLSQVTWTGADAATNDKWSDANNWQGHVVPAATDDLTFPTVTGSALTSNNDLTAGTSFDSLTISGSGYTIGGNGIALTGLLQASQSSGSSTVNLPVDFGGNAGLAQVNTAGAILVLGGIVSGTGGVTKQGSGELDLTAANNYTGTTTVSAGVLHVDGSVGGLVAVGSGATLGGVGTVGSITTTKATLTPGDATPATLTDTGALTLDSGSTYTVTLNSDSVFSQMQVAGAINLAGATLSLALGSSFTPTGTDQFTIIKNTGSAPITGTFAGLAEGGIVKTGTEQFKISYKGGAGNDVVLTHLVDTTTTLSPVTISPIFGQSVALTATVTANASGFGTFSGSVDFKSSTTDLGSAPVNASGVATLNTTSLSTGPNSITAVYSGDPTFASSTSTAIGVGVGQASSMTTLSTSPNPSLASQQVTVTANVVAVSPGSGIPTGSVEFFNGATDLGPGTLSGGVATLRTSSLPVGSNTITAVYSGDTNFTKSTAAGITQKVSLGNVTVTVSIPNTNPFGLTPVALSATVAAGTAAGTPTPTGSVTFFDIHGTKLGSGTLTNGTASLTVPLLPIGPESIKAVYSGDANYSGATSPTVPLVVGSRAELFVNQVFLDVFGGPAGYGENYWVALFNGGVPPKQIASLIVGSQPAKAAAVNNAYMSYLGRPATKAEQVRAIAVPNPSLIALDASLLGSREFYKTRAGGTTQGFLAALGHAWFGAGFSFSPRVQARLTHQLKHGVSRRQVALGVITSPSGIHTEVNNLVEGILQRPATRKEVNRFGPIIKRGQVSPVAVSLFGSREFIKKFVNII